MLLMHGQAREAKELSTDDLRQAHVVQPAHQDEDQSLPDEAEVSPQMPAAEKVVAVTDSRLPEEEG